MIFYLTEVGPELEIPNVLGRIIDLLGQDFKVEDKATNHAGHMDEGNISGFRRVVICRGERDALTARFLESGLVVEIPAAARRKQRERFGSYQDETLHIDWVGVRCNDQNRLLGATVTPLVGEAARPGKEKRRYFFALQNTPHDYGKTLAGNSAQLMGFIEKIKEVILQQLKNEQETQAAAEAAGATAAPSKPLEQIRKPIRYDRSQAEATNDLRANTARLILGGPGSGKTLVLIQLGQRLPTRVVTRAELLAEQINKELSSNDQTEYTKERLSSHAICFDDFLKKMSRCFPELNLLNNTDPPRIEVNWAFFETWCKQNTKKSSKPTDISYLKALWSDFCHVILRPDWSKPEDFFIGASKYAELGSKEAIIPRERRQDRYKEFFEPLIQIATNRKEYYFPIYEAHLLYNALLNDKNNVNPRLAELSEFFEYALSLDEAQQFHALEIACLLESVIHDNKCLPIVISADVNQSGPFQQLRFANLLFEFFHNHKVDVQTCYLSENHRNPKRVGAFVGRTKQIADVLFGAKERETYFPATQRTVSDQEGIVEEIRRFSDELRDAVANDANAYIVVPNEIWKERVAENWPVGQVATWLELSGLSVPWLIMVGFTEEYEKILTAIQDEWGNMTFGEGQLPFARPKQIGSDSVEKREILEVLLTTAARTTERLSIMGTHPLVERIIGGNAPEVAEVQAPMPERKPSSLEDWFKRAKQDYAAGLKTQAISNLTDENRWGAKKVEQIKAWMKEFEVFDDEFFEKAQATLFPRNIPAAGAANDHASLPRDHSDKRRRRKQPGAKTQASLTIEQTPAPLVFKLPRPGCPDPVGEMLKTCQQLGLTFEQFLWANSGGYSTIRSLCEDPDLSVNMLKSTINSNYLVGLLMSLSEMTLRMLGGYWLELGLPLIDPSTKNTISSISGAVQNMKVLDVFISLELPEQVRLVLFLGAEVNTASDDNPLCSAAIAGNVAIGKMLLECSADWNKQSPIPFMCAASHNNPDFVRLLLRHNFNTTLNFQPSPGFIPLIFPEMNPKIKEVLDKVTEHNPLTAIQYCKVLGKRDVATVIIQHAVDRRNLATRVKSLLSHFDPRRLIDLCSEAEDPGIFSMPLGVDVEHNDHSTTLHAYLAENPEHLNGLIACYLNTLPGMDPDQEKIDFRLLDIAGSESLVKIKRVQEYLKIRFDTQKVYPFLMPEQLYPLHIAAACDDQDWIEVMIQLGADPDVNTEHYRDTALLTAARCKSLNALTALLNCMTKPDAHINKLGLTPLLMAVFAGREEAVLAIANAVPVWLDHITNCPGDIFHGYTPLTLAAKNGNRVMVEALIAAGANVNPGEYGPLTPLNVALGHATGKPDINDIFIALLSAGATLEKFNADLLITHALIRAQIPLLTALAQRGIDFNQPIEIEFSNYMVLVGNSSAEKALRLRQYCGRDLPNGNPNGTVQITPLQLAEAIGFTDAITLLREITGVNARLASGPRHGFFDPARPASPKSALELTTSAGAQPNGPG